MLSASSKAVSFQRTAESWHGPGTTLQQRSPLEPFHTTKRLGICRQNCIDTMWPEATASAPMVLPDGQQETMSLLKMEQGQWASSEKAEQDL